MHYRNSTTKSVISHSVIFICIKLGFLVYHTRIIPYPKTSMSQQMRNLLVLNLLHIS